MKTHAWRRWLGGSKVSALLLFMTLLSLEAFAIRKLGQFEVAQLEIDLTVKGNGTAQIEVDTGDPAGPHLTSLRLDSGANRLRVGLGDGRLRPVRIHLGDRVRKFRVDRLVAHGRWLKVSWGGAELRKRVKGTHDLSLKPGPRLSGTVTGKAPTLTLSVPAGITKRPASSLWLLISSAWLVTVLAWILSHRVSERFSLFARSKRALDAIARALSDDDFVVFSPVTLTVCVVPVVLALVLSVAKVHTSSASAWNAVVPQTGTNDLIYGTPLHVRSDEWKDVPLQLAPTPGVQLSEVIHASQWGHLIDAEYGVAWSRNFPLAHQFIAAFACFLLLTRSDFWVSLTCTLWFCFSSHVQWWDMTEVGDIFVLILGGSYFLRGKSDRQVLAGVMLLAAGGLGLLAALYPPWQVPLGYMTLLAIVTPLFERKTRAQLRLRWRTKAVAAGIGMVVLSIVAAIAYQRLGPHLELIASTVYPGERRSQSGGVPLARIFSGFYDTFLSSSRVPASMGNASEAGNFVLLFPCSAALVVARVWRRKVVPSLVLGMLIYIGFLLWWMAGDVNGVLAVWTLMDRVPPIRALATVGVANIIIVASMLAAGRRDPTLLGRQRRMWMVMSLPIVGVTLALHAGLAQRTDPVFYTSFIILFGVGSALLMSAGLLLEKLSLFALGAFAMVVPNAAIHPIDRGFAAISEKHVVELAKQIHERDPAAKWLVYGGGVDAKLLSASGADVWNNRAYPDIEEMRALDPRSAHVSIWNRYSAFRSAWEVPEGAPTEFKLTSADFWGMGVSPTATALRKIGVRFLAFRGMPNLASLSTLRQLEPQPVNGFWLFETNERHRPTASLLAGYEAPQGICGSVGIGKTVVARIQQWLPRRIVDALVEEDGSWRRCLIGVPAALDPRVADKGREVTAIRCPRIPESRPVVHVLLEGRTALRLSEASRCE